LRDLVIPRLSLLQAAGSVHNSAQSLRETQLRATVFRAVARDV
jgi:hypothetical protein